jgi:hypothetical protein
MKKVIVTTRAVYHKIASIEINIPSHIDDDDVRDWLWDNEHFFIDELDDKLSDASYEFGRGLIEGMDDDSCDSETRYDILSTDGKIYYGGHC